MENYEAPKMEIIVFENEDLIVTSGCGGTTTGTADICVEITDNRRDQ